MTEAARAYEKRTGIRINVIGGGATLGIRATVSGDTDMGGTCRPHLPDRFNEEKGAYLTHVAWDALVFITHHSNPVNNITLKQAKDILLGKITNWRELGGPDKRIILVLRAQNPDEGERYSGVGYMLRLMLFNGSDIDFSKNAIYVRDSEKVEEVVETTRYTFAVTGVSSARKRGLKILSLDGIEPTKENIASGRYPLFRPLFIVTKGMPAGKVKDFIEWILSKEGQKIISDEGTVNLEEGRGLKGRFKFMDLR
ncbi:MAG: phosphate ABC transporter substrate-binding protein [Thermodesulfovibrionia bacterium]